MPLELVSFILVNYFKLCVWINQHKNYYIGANWNEHIKISILTNLQFFQHSFISVAENHGANCSIFRRKELEEFSGSTWLQTEFFNHPESFHWDWRAKRSNSLSTWNIKHRVKIKLISFQYYCIYDVIYYYQYISQRRHGFN